MTTASPLATREDYLQAVERATAAADAYYNGAGDITMDDLEYDTLVRDILAFERANPEWKTGHELASVAGGVSTGDVPHSIPMLSLDNVFSDEELNEWEASLTRRLGHEPAGFTIEPKMDGLAIAARYVNGRLTQLITRGDGAAGEDVTYAAPTIVGLPASLGQPLTFEARGEVLLTDAQFEAANELRIAHGDKPFVNPRNGAAGTLRGAKDRAYVIGLTFYGYGVVDLSGTVFPEDEPHSVSMGKLADLGISTTGTSSAGMGVVADANAAHAWIQNLVDRRAELGFAIDGAVIKADSPADRTKAGFSSRAPRWGIARKFPADSAITTLLDVTWGIGRTGLITPRAVLEPVFVGGTTVSAATLHNPADIQRRGLMQFDRVVVLRAGEVIPRVEAPLPELRDGTQKPIAPPTECPRCGSPIDKSQERWRCSTGRKCALREGLRYAVSRDALDCEGVGEKLVIQLVDSGLVGDIADLFALTREQLLTLDRMGAVTADKVLGQIERAKSAPLSRVVTALGILGTGRSMSRRIARHFGSMDALRAATAAQLEEVDGIGSEKAPVIVAELVELSGVLDKLVAAGVNQIEEAASSTTAEGGAPADLPFAGMAVCVSGAVPGLSRNEANEWVERLGGRSASSVSKNTSLLVFGSGAGSKVAKAGELGVATMPAEAFAVLVAAHS